MRTTTALVLMLVSGCAAVGPLEAEGGAARARTQVQFYACEPGDTAYWTSRGEELPHYARVPVAVYQGDAIETELCGLDGCAAYVSDESYTHRLDGTDLLVYCGIEVYPRHGEPTREVYDYVKVTSFADPYPTH